MTEEEKIALLSRAEEIKAAARCCTREGGCNQSCPFYVYFEKDPTYCRKVGPDIAALIEALEAELAQTRKAKRQLMNRCLAQTKGLLCAFCDFLDECSKRGEESVP